MTITISQRRLNAFVVAIIAVALLAIMAACASVPTSQQVEGSDQEGVSANYTHVQPIPKPPWSQMRQNLIEIEQAQADGVQTTSFFFNPNVQDPYKVCPSVGTPIAASTSLSNPEQLAIKNYGSSNYGTGVIGQMDPNGVYTPPSTNGTYVICILPSGKPEATYAEGIVHTEYAPAMWDMTKHQVVILGLPTTKFTTKKGQ